MRAKGVFLRGERSDKMEEKPRSCQFEIEITRYLQVLFIPCCHNNTAE